MARTTPKPPTRRTRNSPARRLAARSTAPSALSSSKPNCAPIRAAAPTVSWNAGRSSTTPASASIRRATSSGYKATRSAMGDMAKSLERDPQLESILANRKRDLGIAFESGRRLGQELAFTHGIDLGRGRGIGI